VSANLPNKYFKKKEKTLAVLEFIPTLRLEIHKMTCLSGEKLVAIVKSLLKDSQLLQMQG